MTCGCKIKTHGIDIVPTRYETVIVYCPLHVAAPELLKALKEMLESECTHRADDCGTPHHVNACEAIKKAEGGGNAA